MGHRREPFHRPNPSSSKKEYADDVALFRAFRLFFSASLTILSLLFLIPCFLLGYSLCGYVSIGFALLYLVSAFLYARLPASWVYVDYSLVILVSLEPLLYYFTGPYYLFLTFVALFVPVVTIITIGRVKGSLASLLVFVLFLVSYFYPPFRTDPNLSFFGGPSPRLTYYVTYGLAFVYIYGIGFINRDFVLAHRKRERNVEVRYRYAAEHDALTGCVNQSFLSEYVRHLDQHFRNGDQIGVLFLDIDNFKRLNDTYGHLFGNEVLKAFGALLKNQGAEFACRWGGDEFLLLFRNESRKRLEAAALRIKAESMKIPVPFEGASPITTSIGLCLKEYGPDYSFDSAVEEADRVEYEIKRNGKNDCQFSEPGKAEEGR